MPDATYVELIDDQIITIDAEQWRAETLHRKGIKLGAPHVARVQGQRDMDRPDRSTLTAADRRRGCTQAQRCER